MLRRLIGLILLVVGGGIAAIVIFSNLTGGSSYSVSLLGQHVSMNVLGLFCLGLALALLFSLGLAMLLKGRRHRHRGARGTRAGDAEAPRPT